LPVRITVVVLPLQTIGDVTEIVPDIISGSVISKVPDAGVHPFMSLTIHWYPVPGDIPLNIPEVLVIPLKVNE